MNTTNAMTNSVLVPIASKFRDVPHTSFHLLLVICEVGVTSTAHRYLRLDRVGVGVGVGKPVSGMIEHQ